MDVETYQMAKNKNSGTSDETLETRVENLENQQMNIYNEFCCDFKNEKYNDLYNSTVIFGDKGIVARQYKNSIFYNFAKNDDCIDYDNSINVEWRDSNYLRLISTEKNGTIYLFPIKLENAAGIKLDSNYILPFSVSGSQPTQITENLCNICEVDKNGRLWIFSKNSATNTADEKIQLAIYNADGSLYLSKEYENFFYTKVTQNANFNRNNITMKFNDENLCFIAGIFYDCITVLCIDIKNDTTNCLYKKALPGYMPNIYRDSYWCGLNFYIFGNIFKITIGYPFINGYHCGGYAYPSSYVNLTLLYSNEAFVEIYYDNYDNYRTASGGPLIIKGQLFGDCMLLKNNKLYYLQGRNANNTENTNLSDMTAYIETIGQSTTSVKTKSINCITNDLTEIHVTGLFGNLFCDNYLYNICNPENENSLYIRKYSYEDGDNFNLTKEKEIIYTLSAPATVANVTKLMPVIFEFKNQIYIFYMTYESTQTTNKYCIKLLTVDKDLEVVLNESVIFETENIITYFDTKVLGNNINVYAAYTEDNNPKCIVTTLTETKPRIQYMYLDNVNRIWTSINPGDSVNFDSPVTSLKLKCILESDSYSISPLIKSIDIQSWDNGGENYRQSEYYSNQIDTIQNDGKGVLTAECEAKDGTIDWYVSFNGGKTYEPVNLDEEFVYTHITAPDFRVKAILSVKDDAKKIPIVHSYTLKTSHVVLHSDLEEIQINLMKTNFKIDTYTNATKNGLLKMTIDVLSTEDGIDKENSDYIYYPSQGYAGGNYIQTVPENIENKITTILLTTDEVLDKTKPNSKINYFVSTDNGITFIPITPNVKTQITNTNTENSQLVMKAVFYDNAKLTAWGWAWD